MLTITKLKGAEYLISSVADGMEDYFMGAGEAPGVWRGRWAATLELEGVVGADDLRALVNGLDPQTGVDLLAGHRDRKVAAVDVTMSCPKSVSLLWAFGTPETSAAVSIAVVEATDLALGFLEERAAFARQQHDGRRRRVATGGFAVATFAHRTSRAGDPQLHTHCLIPNVVERADGQFVAFDANPMHTWAKAAGTVFLNELERLLTQRLGVAWGPERNGSREMVGFTPDQLRSFSKRTAAIEAHLEAHGELAFDTKRDRMRADDRASLKTRARKDRTVTPDRLRDRWHDEAVAVGLEPGAGVDGLVVGHGLASRVALTDEQVFAALVDPATGLCATQSRFCEAHVVERVAAMSGGAMSVEEIVATSNRFLSFGLVVRLAPDAGRRRPPEWSTVELRTVEDLLLAQLGALAGRTGHAVPAALVETALAAEPRRLGDDQAEGVRVLCGAGSSVRALAAPAGYGKTTALHAAVSAAQKAGRPVVVVAPTHKAVAELRAAGLPAHTVARLRRQLATTPLDRDTIMVVDETSQLGTRDAAALIEAVSATSGAQLWCAGDVRQAQSVVAGGLAVELERLAHAGQIPAASLVVNRRQQHPGERQALTEFRAGDLEASRAIRAEYLWEHELATPADTRSALAEAATGDADRYGPQHVAVLAVSHADAEDLADRIRAIRAARGELRGPTLTGPAWGPDPRVYAAGDRILVHANLEAGRQPGVFNGATGTVQTISGDGLTLLLDGGPPIVLPAAVVAGSRPDGTPNLSHGWARTVDGAQGGTWHQVHLLGTPTLDRFTGYVGQSRGRQPTHTWNTRPDADHPASLLADQRTPTQAVMDAMGRAEPKTFAAAHDPWTLDRTLRAERDEHAATAATRPPDPSEQLETARQALTSATAERERAVQDLTSCEQRRDRLGGMHRIRRGGRDDLARADQSVAGAARRVERTTEAERDARSHVVGLDAILARRAAWDETHGWRLDRIVEIDRTLAHHWADIVLRAVRADDPLAFGVARVREARVTYKADLRTIVSGLPMDRRDILNRAQYDLQHRQTNVTYAERNLAHAQAALTVASSRRRGRLDKTNLASAQADVRDAERRLRDAEQAVDQARGPVAKEQAAVDAWANASAATADERQQRTAEIKDLDDALAMTRPNRVATAAADPTSRFWSVLGPPPASRGGLAAWCGIAERVETWNDQHPQPADDTDAAFGAATDPLLGTRPTSWARPAWDQLALLVHHAPTIIDAAGRLDPTPAHGPLDNQSLWQQAVREGTSLIRASAPSFDQGLDVGL